MNYTVYVVNVSKAGAPMVFSKVEEGLSRSKANRLASQMRKNKADGTQIAVYNGNNPRSMF